VPPRSGWLCSASLRYACRTSAAAACGGRPSTRRGSSAGAGCRASCSCSAKSRSEISIARASMSDSACSGWLRCTCSHVSASDARRPERSARRGGSPLPSPVPQRASTGGTCGAVSTAAQSPPGGSFATSSTQLVSTTVSPAATHWRSSRLRPGSCAKVRSVRPGLTTQWVLLCPAASNPPRLSMVVSTDGGTGRGRWIERPARGCASRLACARSSAVSGVSL